MHGENIFIVSWWYRLLGNNARRVWRVLLVTFLFGVIGAGLGIWQAVRTPPHYQVQIAMAVYPTHFRWNMDTRLQTLQRPRNDARNMALVMAKGPNVLNEVIRRMGDQMPPELRDREALKKRLVARGGEGVYIYLSVNGQDPDFTYTLATTWAQVVEEEVEKAFYRYDADLPALTEQLKKAEAELTAIEQEIEAFRARTGIDLVSANIVAVSAGQQEAGVPVITTFRADTAQLGYVNSTLAEYRYAQRVLRNLATQVDTAQAEGRPLSDVPLELVADLRVVQARGRLTVEGLRALGEDYAAVALALRAEADALQPSVDLLAREAEQLQSTLAANLTRARELYRQRTTVENLYKALLAKQQELQAEAAVSSNYVEVVDVLTPQVSGLLGVLVHAVAGAVLGLFLGFTLATTWYAVRLRGHPAS